MFLLFPGLQNSRDLYIESMPYIVQYIRRNANKVTNNDKENMLGE